MAISIVKTDASADAKMSSPRFPNSLIFWYVALWPVLLIKL